MNKAPLILSVDTATEFTSVALVSGEQTLTAQLGTLPSAHTAQLIAFIDDALRSTGTTLRDVEVFAVASGPGSFTGLRAGLATIKALAYATQARIAPIPTLHALALAEGETDKRIIVLSPAGRKEVFTQTLALDVEGKITELSAPRHAAPEVLLADFDSAEKNLLWVGAGARLYADHILQRAHHLSGLHSSDEESGERQHNVCGWRIAAPAPTPLALAVARLGLQSVISGRLVSASELRALYVRPSDAELNL